MVLLHGFGGTSMTYVRFFKNLKNYYRMHAIDALGVGHSSKGVFKENFTYE
jgi:pimeloyl-ACP methyl ester carboxylesterase